MCTNLWGSIILPQYKYVQTVQCMGFRDNNSYTRDSITLLFKLNYLVIKSKQIDLA